MLKHSSNNKFELYKFISINYIKVISFTLSLSLNVPVGQFYILFWSKKNYTLTFLQKAFMKKLRFFLNQL